MTDLDAVLKIAREMRATLPHVTTTISGDVVMCSFPCCPRQFFDPINNGADFERVIMWALRHTLVDWNSVHERCRMIADAAENELADSVVRGVFIHAIAEVL